MPVSQVLLTASNSHVAFEASSSTHHTCHLCNLSHAVWSFSDLNESGACSSTSEEEECGHWDCQLTHTYQHALTLYVPSTTAKSSDLLVLPLEFAVYILFIRPMNTRYYHTCLQMTHNSSPAADLKTVTQTERVCRTAPPTLYVVSSRMLTKLERSGSVRTFRYFASSPPLRFSTTLNGSLPGRFALANVSHSHIWTFRYQDVSLSDDKD